MKIYCDSWFIGDHGSQLFNVDFIYEREELL